MSLSKSKMAWVAFVAMLPIAACTRKDQEIPSEANSPVVAAAPLRAIPPQVRTDRLDESKTTRDILNALSKDCLACAEKNDCLNPAKGSGICETMPGISKISGQAESALCLDALRCIFTSKCANTGEENPCLCGPTDPMACFHGDAPPMGSCVSEFKKDYGDNGKTMYDNFINQTYGDGRANTIIQCVVPLCPTCRIP
jgi:hypothetical protein